MIDYLTLRKD